MAGIISAIRFLTIIPIGGRREIDEAGMPQGMVYFPLVGLLLGLILAGASNLLSLINGGQFFSSVIVVTLLTVLTGGLHMDGLADTFDALSSRKGSDEMLKIMRDSHIGTMGTLSLISIFLIKVGCLSSLDPDIVNPSLILMCVLSRYFLVFSMFFFPYARDEGKAKPFFEGINLGIFSLATLITLLCAGAFLDLKGLITLAMTAIFVFLSGKFIANKIGGLTGDALGAISESAEGFILLSILILTRCWT